MQKVSRNTVAYVVSGIILLMAFMLLYIVTKQHSLQSATVQSGTLPIDTSSAAVVGAVVTYTISGTVTSITPTMLTLSSPTISNLPVFPIFSGTPVRWKIPQKPFATLSMVKQGMPVFVTAKYDLKQHVWAVSNIIIDNNPNVKL